MKRSKDTNTEKEVGYWRKANAIHGWFVNNVQKGIDDCKEYPVTIRQLKALLSTCKEVRKSIIDGGFIEEEKDVTFINDGKFKKKTITVKRPTFTTVADELLPPQAGFFFGSTDIDSYYLDDIEDTIEILEKTINLASNADTFSYQSSW
jgi:hypothetical protein